MGMSLAHTKRQGTKDWVGFQVGTIDYALDIHRVREVVRPLPCMTLPNLPQGVNGVAEFRGRMIPVIDLRKRFGIVDENPGRQGRWIVVPDGERLVALAVDRVTEVFGRQLASPREIPSIIQSSNRAAIASAYFYLGHLVFVVAVDDLIDVTRQLDVSALQLASRDAEETRK